MKTIHDILKLGDPRLYEVCTPVLREELPEVPVWIQQLHEAMEDVRRVYGFGRGIAAPQLGIMKRLFYLQLDRPYIVINPELKGLSEEVLQEVAENLPITKGAHRLISTLKSYGFKTAILSGGFTYFGKYLQKELGIDYVHANQLEIKDGVLTGGYLGEIVDGNKKAEYLKEILD